MAAITDLKFGLDFCCHHDEANQTFTTKGDANNAIDSVETKNSQVLGKGTDWCIPYIGYYASYIYNHKYILYIAISILIIDLCNDYYTIRKKKVGVVDEENT